MNIECCSTRFLFKIAAFLAVGLLITPILSAQDLVWVRHVGSIYQFDGTRSVAVAADGGVLVSGNVGRATIFAQGEPEETILNGVNDRRNMFFAKYRHDGSLDWVRNIDAEDGSTQFSIAAGIDGGVWLLGRFSGNAIIGPDEPGETVVTDDPSINSVGGTFIAKCNDDGELVWVQIIESVYIPNGPDYWISGRSISNTPDGGVIVTGGFKGRVTFSRGQAEETTIISEGTGDIFVAKFGPDGQLKWVRQAGGDRLDGGHSIAATPDDGAVVTGFFEETATFGQGEPDETTLVGRVDDDYGDRFVAKFNSDGTLAWAHSITGGTEPVPRTSTSATIDGGAWVTGMFNDIIDFGPYAPEPGVLRTGSIYDYSIFIARYTADGAVAWIRQDAKGGPYRESEAVAVAPDGGAWVTGHYGYSATFGAGEENETTLHSHGYRDVFVARYHPDGTLAWARSAGGQKVDHAYSIAVVSDIEAYVAGTFEETAIFGPGEPGETSLTSFESEKDIFIALIGEPRSIPLAVGLSMNKPGKDSENE